MGRALGEKAQPGDVILLAGPLGAGKTCLTQGIAMGLDVPGYVRSPSFVLMTRYSGRLTLHHLDLYRIGSSGEGGKLTAAVRHDRPERRRKAESLLLDSRAGNAQRRDREREGDVSTEPSLQS